MWLLKSVFPESILDQLRHSGESISTNSATPESKYTFEIRDWSLITGRGATKREGGHVKFYLYEKGGGGVLVMLKGGGHNKFWGSFYAVAWKF